MQPLSPATARLFERIEFAPEDRLSLCANETQSKFTAKFWGETTCYGGTRIGNPSRGVRVLINRLPEKKELKGKFGAWELGATDYTCELLHSLFPREQMKFADEDSELLFAEILTRSLFADKCANVTANYKAAKIVPQHNIEYSEEYPLSPYQQVAAYNMLHSWGYQLLMEAGTGKTAPSIATVCNAATALQERISRGEEPPRMLKVIIVCPNNARKNWEAEFQKFATQPGQTTVLRGTALDRVRQMIDASQPQPGSLYTVVICGYDTLTASWDALQLWEWDIALLDESHYIASTRTQRYKTAMKLRDRSQQRYVLTGTAIRSTVMDLYAQFEFIGKGLSGFSSFEAYRKFYGVFEPSSDILVSCQNLPFMQERLAKYAFNITKKEALPDLPDKVYDIVECEMTPQQAEFYDKISEQLAVEIEEELATSTQPRSMVVNNVLVKLLRLAQITSGFMVWNPIYSDTGEMICDRRIEYFAPPNTKIQNFLELMQEKTPEQKTIVWAQFIPDIEYLQAAAEQNGIDYVSFYGATSYDDRLEAERRFNYDNNCRLFIGNPVAGGTALNLLGYPPTESEAYSTNCDHIIVFSQGWQQPVRTQSEERAYRRGTRVQVRVTDLVVPNTIDEEIRARVIKKQLHALEVNDLRDILANVLKRGTR